MIHIWQLLLLFHFCNGKGKKDTRTHNKQKQTNKQTKTAARGVRFKPGFALCMFRVVCKRLALPIYFRVTPSACWPRTAHHSVYYLAFLSLLIYSFCSFIHSFPGGHMFTYQPYYNNWGNNAPADSRQKLCLALTKLQNGRFKWRNMNCQEHQPSFCYKGW